ncbi:MAG: DMT family transporter [Gudongella sp.]|nr:DMT family transporter [Gudongella sp.]
MSNYSKGVILALLSALSFAFLPIFIVFAYDGGVNAQTMLLIRFTTASILMFTYIYYKYGTIKVTKKALFGLFLLGVFGYTVQSRLYFTSIKYISPSMASMFLYTYPILVGILSFLIDREKPTLNLFIATAISFIGLVLILGSSLGKANIVGILFVSAAAIVYSVYIVSSNKVIKKTPALLSSAYIALFSAIGSFILGSFSGGFDFSFQASAWIPSLGIAVVSTVIAMVTFFKSMEYIGPTKTSIISLTEVFFTVVLSAIILHDFLSPIQMVGGACIISGAYLVAKA